MNLHGPLTMRDWICHPASFEAFMQSAFWCICISCMFGKLYLAGLQEGKLGYQVQVQSFRRPSLLVSQVCVTTLTDQIRQ